MYETLEKYLQEVNHYLAVKRGADEILREIRSHILEKTENENGQITEDSLQRIIAEYGKPQEVAGKYLEGCEVILPTFKRYLFLYTGVLFAIHFTLTIVALIFKTSMVVMPIFVIPRMSIFIAIFYIPMAFIYDFGLVALFLYLVTQKKKDIRLPWPDVLKRDRTEPKLKAPKIAVLVCLLIVFAVLFYLFVQYQTIFFYSVNFSKPESLLQPASSVFFSTMFLAALLCEIIGYSVRFVVNSRWVNLAKETVVLILLWFIWNSPVRPEYATIPRLDMRFVGGAFVILVTFLAAIRFLRSLIQVTREMSMPRVAD
jgi:hypothetical protein